jgi:hypothetical protein
MFSDWPPRDAALELEHGRRVADVRAVHQGAERAVAAADRPPIMCGRPMG